MAITVGIVTIGQALRVDVVPEMAELLGPTRIIEAGALDGLAHEDIEGFNRATRAELAARLGVPLLVANLLVGRLVAELVEA